MSASSSHSPLHKPEQGDAWAPPLDMALGLAREALVEQADANVYDKQAMIAAAVQLEIRLRGLVAALDKDKELAAAVAAHGAFPMPAGDTARRPRRFTPLEEAVRNVETAIAPLKGDQRAGADMVLTYLRTLTTPDTTVPRDLRPGADAARRMIADRQTAEDPHDSPLHRTYETSHDLPETAPDPLAYGPTGYRCGCGKDAHSNLTPCQPMTADEWNARYPVGTPVTAYPVTRDDEGLTTVTRTPAWTLGHGAAVVSVDGYAGGICLTHVDPMPGGAS